MSLPLSCSSANNKSSTSQVDKPRYRSAIGPRSSSTSTRMRTSASPFMITSASVSLPPPPLLLSLPSSASVPSSSASLVKTNRERERRELIELNDRFANYVERVRFLEAQNKKLRLEGDALRKQLGENGENSKMKEMYETELREARALVDETSKQKSDFEIHMRKLEDEVLDLKDRLESLQIVRSSERKSLDNLSRQVADNEAELGLLHRRIRDTEADYKRQKSEAQKLSAQIQNIMNELYQETSVKLQLQNEKQSLEEEINFLRQIHAQELEDIRAANASSYDSSLDPSVFFKHELSNAIKDIRYEYETLNQQQRQEIENWYRLKVTEAVQELQTRRPTSDTSIGRLRDDEELRQLREQVTSFRKDAGHLRSKNKDLEGRVVELERVIDHERRQGQQDISERDREIMDLRAKFEQIISEYDDLVSSKTTLDTEISIYRKLLEGEEHRSRSAHLMNDENERRFSDESVGAFESVVEANELQTQKSSTVTGDETPSAKTLEKRVHFDSNVLNLHPSEESLVSLEERIAGVEEEQQQGSAIQSIINDVLSKTVTPSSAENIAGIFAEMKSIGDKKSPQILLNVSLVGTSDGAAAARRMSLVVRQARDLIIPKQNVSLYARCVVPRPHKQTIRQKSHSVAYTPSPIWNTLFEFDYETDWDVQLAVKATSSSSNSRRALLIGSIKLSGEQLMETLKDEDQWFDLVSVVDNSTQSATSSSNESSEETTNSK